MNLKTLFFTLILAVFIVVNAFGQFLSDNVQNDAYITTIHKTQAVDNPHDLIDPLILNGLPYLILDLRYTHRPNQAHLIEIPPENEDWIRDAEYHEYDDTENLISTGFSRIRARGNSTRWWPKTPYNLRFENNDEHRPFFGMPAHFRFALLANHADKTLLRGEVAFDFLGAILDNMAWVPRTEHLDLYLNGTYRGIYQAVENIRDGIDRIDIDLISLNDLNGGFILEHCIRRDPTEFLFDTTTARYSINLTLPSIDLPAARLDTTHPDHAILVAVRDYMTEVENAVFSSNFTHPETGWRKYFDIYSFIDWYLVNEISKNPDARDISSVYMYYDPAFEKLFKGPLWDFDLGFGNYGTFQDMYVWPGTVRSPQGFWISHHSNVGWPPPAKKFYPRLFEDPTFVAAVVQRWNDKKTEIDNVLAFIDDRVEYLNDAQIRNFQKWPIAQNRVELEKPEQGNHTFEWEVNFLKNWLSQRIAWLDNAFNQMITFRSIQDIRTNPNLNNGTAVIISGVALNNQDDITDTTNDFFVQSGDFGIKIIGKTVMEVISSELYTPGISPRPVFYVSQGETYTIVGNVRITNGIRTIEPNGIIRSGTGVLPEPFIETTNYFTNPETAKPRIGTLIGIKSFYPIEDWTLNQDGFIDLISFHGDIRARFNENIVDIFPTSYFDIVGVLNEDIQGFYVQILSNNDLISIDTDLIFPSPTNLNGNVNNNNVELLWDAPVETIYSDVLLGYQVLRDEELLTDYPIHEQTFFDSNLVNGDYIYQIIAVYQLGKSNPIDIEINILVSENDLNELSKITELVGNFPNPFNPETVIRFNISHICYVKIEIFNLRGQLVRILVEGTHNAGEHNIIWNGQDDMGQEVGNGIYFYRMIAGDLVQTRRMVLLK